MAFFLEGPTFYTSTLFRRLPTPEACTVWPKSCCVTGTMIGHGQGVKHQTWWLKHAYRLVKEQNYGKPPLSMSTSTVNNCKWSFPLAILAYQRVLRCLTRGFPVCGEDGVESVLRHFREAKVVCFLPLGIPQQWTPWIILHVSHRYDFARRFAST